MPIQRVRFMIGSVLIAIAAIGICLGAFRHHLSLGSFVTGALALTLVRTFEVIVRCRDLGTPLSGWRKVSLILWSLAIATVILAVSSCVCVVSFFACGGGYGLHWRHGGTVTVGPLLCGAFAGFCACTLLRWILWQYRYPTRTEGLAADTQR
jgi:hypothetical protein